LKLTTSASPGVSQSLLSLFLYKFIKFQYESNGYINYKKNQVIIIIIKIIYCSTTTETNFDASQKSHEESSLFSFFE